MGSKTTFGCCTLKNKLISYNKFKLDIIKSKFTITK